MSIISTITRSIVGARRKRVAITGLRNTGKTVFITSLINHLKDHDPEKFDIDGKRKASINWLDTVSAEDGNEFPYDQYRLRMGTEKRWPRKTGECLQYKCRIQPEHFWCSEILLELRDFPGERFNDAPMYGLNYRKWSDFVLNWLERDDTYAKHSEDYRNLLDKAELSEEEILIEYKRTLAKLTMAYKPLISPSTFLLDLEGTEATNKPIEELVAERHVGVDAGQQFTPLSSRAAETNPAIAEAFQAHYQDYQQQVVNPLVKSLRQCDQLVFLVDIPAILMAGPGMLNDSREALDRLLRAVKDHGGAIVNTLVDLFTSPLPLEWKPGGIRQICFVAAKSDMVTEDDQGNLKHLLEDMFKGKAARLHSQVSVEYKVCSAVVSASPDSKRGNWLSGRLIRRHGETCQPDDPDVAFEIPVPVPKEWEDDWETGKYVFPEVFPQFPKPEFKPPRQTGLDKIMEYLLSR